MFQRFATKLFLKAQGFSEKTQRLAADKRGQGLSEYGVLVGFIVLAVIALIVIFRDDLVKMWEDFTKAFKGYKTP